MKRIVGKRHNPIPFDILHNEALNHQIAKLPSNYNFEIHKTLWRIREVSAKSVGLQLPEGLVLYSPLLVHIIRSFGRVECVLLADVVYGACCVDDLTADALGLDFLVHYAHTCLVPINETCMKTLYVFVEIHISVERLVQKLAAVFPPDTSLALIGTIQFAQALNEAAEILQARGYSQLLVPQTKPRFPGEVLGCTSPTIAASTVVSVSDGRFHLESAMIQNPQCRFYKYDPYTQQLTTEEYDLAALKATRRPEIEKAAKSQVIGLILGTLGRQGSPSILKSLESLLTTAQKDYIVFLMPEVTTEALAPFAEVEAWVQVACPRLSMDWGSHFPKPLLNSYEAFVAFKGLPLEYPQDYYSYEGGEWSNYKAKAVWTDEAAKG